MSTSGGSSGGGGAPTGPAGGDLGGTYPNPTVLSVADVTTGTLALANGGTAHTTAQAAIDALSLVTTSGQYLRGNGTHAVPATIQAADVPTLTQYLLLAGVASGQTASGGTGTTDTLTLNATSNGSPAAGSDIIINTGSTQIARFTQTGNLLGGLITTATAGTNNKSLIWDGQNNGSVQAQNSGLAVSFMGTEIATSSAVGANIDLRSSRGTVASPTALQSGDWIAGFHAGSIGATYGIDCGQFAWLATETHSATATGCQFVLKTTQNTTTTKVVALTIGQDQSVTIANNLTLAGKVNGATNMIDLSLGPSTSQNVITAGFNVWGTAGAAGAPTLIQNRFNGTAGSPTAITSGQTVSVVQNGGTFDTSGVFANSGRMLVVATQNWANSGVSGTAASLGSKIQFQTVPNGSTTQTTALTLDQDGSLLMAQSGAKLGLFGSAGTTKATVTGSKGANAALASLMTALAGYGLVTDSTS